MLSTQETERIQPVALEVPVLVERQGKPPEMHVVYLSQDEVDVTAENIANMVCGDDYWNVSATSDAAPGRNNLQNPGKFTVPYLRGHMGDTVTIVVSSSDPPPISQLPHNTLAGPYHKAQGPPRGSQKGNGRLI